MGNETKKLIVSFTPGVLFTAVLVVIHLVSESVGIHLTTLGVYPLSVKGLIGIITSPFIHKDYDHLFSNAVPIIVLSAGIVYFYHTVSGKVFLIIYLLTGLWVWVFGRVGAYHIGASGLVYGFAGFMFFSGLFRKDRGSIAISLLVAFLYGSMVWGVFPFKPEVSWESHLFGGLTGLALAWYYRNVGVVEDEIPEDDEEEDYSHIPWQIDENRQEQKEEEAKRPKIVIRYTIVPEKPKIEKEQGSD